MPQNNNKMSNNSPLLKYISEKQNTINKHLLHRNVEVECFIDGVPIRDVIEKIEKFKNEIEKLEATPLSLDNDSKKKLYQEKIEIFEKNQFRPLSSQKHF